MIERLENGKWKETGWESFEQTKEYTGDTQKEWSDSGYDYIIVKFSIDDTLEIYRQKAKECECKSCRPEKTIFIFGKTREQAREYIRTNVKIITDEHRLRGYSRGQGILIVLPQGKEHVVEQAKARHFEIIEA